jgi:asparagine synthase (glutamine-hydrolysing)
MSGMVGIVDLHAADSQDGGVDEQRLEAMCRAMDYWRPARLALRNLRREVRDADTDKGGYAHLLPDGSLLVAAARIDNRVALATRLGLHLHELDALDDPSLVARAYLHWGESCAAQLYGDWSFAVWNPRQRRLFLARDHSGNTSLYYHASAGRIAFASSRKALLALGDPEVRRIDDLYIAQVLLAWPVYQGERTVHPAIRRLPPAHTLVVTPDEIASRQYWNLDEVQVQPFTCVQEAADGFLPVFDEAVKCRMRTPGAVGVTLSGGLDSGAVAASAARLSRQSGQKLAAYTAVPCGRTAEDVSERFGDEWWLASATATHAKIPHHRPIPAQAITPLQGLRWYLWAHDEPLQAASNAYWIMALERTARADGCRVLLTGQGGKGGISWTGPDRNLSDAHGALRQVARRLVITSVPKPWAVRTQAAWMKHSEPWRKSLAIHPELVRRVDAVGASLDDPHHPLREPFMDSRTRRLSILQPGRNITGSVHAENGAASDIDVRDPTLDVRVLSYCLSVPEHLLLDKTSSNDRMLIRTAMKSRLPDLVRLNQKRGLQSADLCVRLRADADMMDACLDELERGRARDYLDLSRLRESWRVVRQEDDRVGFREASVVLMRSIMAGLFVNQST